MSPAAQGPVGPVVHRAVEPVAGARFTSGFHADLAARNRRVTIPHGIRMLERAGNLDNLRRLTGAHDGPFQGPRFADSDVYKTLEAVAWELGRGEDAELRAFYEQTVDLLEAAQREDGYLDSAYQLGEPFGAPWSDFVHGHELYCLGHLIQAAIAGERAIGDRRLRGVAERFVACVDDLYGADDRREYCGHPEVETALIELHRLSGDERPLRLAEAFLRRRGSGFLGDGVFGAQYYQDDIPVVETTTMRGHAVRALYLDAGVADLYLERGDAELLRAVEAQWEDLVARRLYLTGGTGARHRDEAFGDAYELPSERAYAETCAGIALVQWGWRMFLATGEARYLDELERCLYNVVLSGISTSGTRFFYSNPLQLRSDHGASQQESAGTRLEWYWCACCPPNLMRLFASLEHLVFARTGEEIRIALLASAELPLPGGAVLRTTSNAPAGGALRIELDGDAGGTPVAVRVPAWARADATVVTVDGAPVDADIVDGWLRLGALAEGVAVDVEFAVEVAVWRPHPGIDAVRHAVAVTRGPLVYCADQVDNDLDIEAVTVRSGGGVVVTEAMVDGIGPQLLLDVDEYARPLSAHPLYRSDAYDEPVRPAPAALVLRPYATWGNGAVPQAMKVWLPRSGTNG